ncbi:IS5/IS1182 family transposase, partial [Gluconobacter kondonii]|nr:IS5/IS1182 family transposase [Gluconobacter kondonii]
LDKTNTASSVWADTAYRSKANEDFMEKQGFADQKSQTGLFVRTVGITRATMRIGLANIVYNIRRFLLLERISTTA